MNSNKCRLQPQERACTSSGTSSFPALLLLLGATASIPIVQPLPAVDSFHWDAIPREALVGTPFPTRIVAQNADGTAAVDFNGDAFLSAFTRSPAGPLLISEVSLGPRRPVEFVNVSTAPVSLENWEVHFYNHDRWPEPALKFSFPPGAVCGPGEVFVINEGGSPPGQWPVYWLGQNLNYASSLFTEIPLAILLCAPGGKVVDFCGINTGSPAVIVPPYPPDAELWHGRTLKAKSYDSVHRVGTFDHNNAADWVVSWPDPGKLHPSLMLPFIPAKTPAPVSPELLTFSQGTWTGAVTLLKIGNPFWIRVNDGAGHSGECGPIAVSPGPPLTLSVPAEADEDNPGSLGVGQVAIPQILNTNLDIFIQTDSAGQISVPSMIVMPAGQINAAFNVTNLDDALFEGPRQITITVSAPGFAPASKQLLQHDNESASLGMHVPETIREGQGLLRGAAFVFVNIPPANTFSVTVSSDNTNELRVPRTVYIPAGQTSAPIDLTVVDDLRLDGPQSVRLGASAPQSGGISGQISVQDNESTNLVLWLAFEVEESQTSADDGLQVTLGGIAISNIVVTISNSNPAVLSVPASLMIPQGSSGVNVRYTAPENQTTDGRQLIDLVASAPGFSPGTRTIAVRDNEVDRLYFEEIPKSQVAGSPFPVTVYAHTIDGYVPTTFAGQGRLRANGHSGDVPLLPADAITFTNGMWAGLATIDAESRGTLLTLEGPVGSHGSSNPFDVLRMATPQLKLSDVAYDSLRDQIIAGVLAESANHRESVVGLDPDTGSVRWSVPLGNVPGKLAIADDFSCVYIAQQSTGGVARLDLATHDLFRFALDPGIALYVETMDVMPGHPDILAVSRLGYGVAIYDAGIKRPLVVGPDTFASGYWIGFFGDSNRLNRAFPGGVHRLMIVPSGVVAASSDDDWVYRSAFHDSAELIYTFNGSVLEPGGLRVVGTFGTSGWVAPDAESGKIVFLSAPDRLDFFGQFDFRLVGSLALPTTSPGPVVHAGSDRLALIFNDNQLAILRTDLLRPNDTANLAIDSVLEPPMLTVGSNTVCRIGITNSGAVSMTNVILVDHLPADCTLVSVSAPGCTWLYTNGNVQFEIPVLHAGSHATLSLTFQPPTPGTLINTVRLLGSPAKLFTNANVASFPAQLPAITEFHMSTLGLLYDAGSNRLWAVVGANEGRIENMLRSLNLRNGLQQTAIPIGTTPRLFTISSDGQYIFTTTASGPNLFRFNTRLALRDQETAINIPMALDAIVGQPETVALSIEGSNPRVYIYSNGVPRWQSPLVACPYLESAPGGRLYGADAVYTAGSVYSFAITNSMVQLLEAKQLLSPSTGLRYAAGRLFAGDGSVISTEPGLTLAARLPVAGRVAPDMGSDAIYYLYQQSSDTFLACFSASTLAPLWSQPISAARGTVQAFELCQPGILAFSTSEDQIMVVNTALLTHTFSSDLQVTFSPATSAGPTNSPFTFTGIINNPGPGPAFNVRATNSFSPGTILLSHYVPRGDATNTGDALIMSFGNLPVGDAVSFTLTAMKTNAGVLLLTAEVISDTPDLGPSNNVSVFSAEVDSPPSADLGVSQVVNVTGTPSSGYLLHCAITAYNHGPETATGVVVSDIFPTYASLVESTWAGGQIRVSQGAGFFDIPTLPPGESVTIEFSFKLANAGFVVHPVTIWGNEADAVPANNASVALTAPGLNGSVLTQVCLTVRDLIYDPLRQRLLATMPAQGSPINRAVVPISLTDISLSAPLYVGEEPNLLALTPEGSDLYVAMASTGLVLRISPETGEVRSRSLLNFADATWIAHDLEPLPGSPGSFAVSSLLGGFYPAAVSIFDGADMRPDFISIPSGGFSIEFDTGTNVLYAASPGGFSSYPINSTGIHSSTNAVFPASTWFVTANRKAFFASGHVFDFASRQLSQPFPISSQVAADESTRVLYYLGSHPFAAAQLQVFDLDTEQELWNVDLSGFIGNVSKLVPLGTNGLAINTDAGRLFILRTDLIRTRTADLEIQPATYAKFGTVNDALNVYFTVLNRGPWTARDVVLTTSLPAGATFSAANPTQGSCLFSSGQLRCEFGSITNWGSAGVMVTISNTQAGVLSSDFAVSQRDPDGDPANNVVGFRTTYYDPPTITVRDAWSSENAPYRSMAFSVRLSCPSSKNVRFQYTTTNGTAVAPRDFLSTSGTIFLPPGYTNTELFVEIVNNSEPGANRSFFVNVSQPENAFLGNTQATGYILEDDFRSLSVQPISQAEGNEGASRSLFTIRLWPPATNTVSVDYTLLDGSATAASDYISKAGTLRFSPGSTNLSLPFSVLGDRAYEADEMFYLLLSDPVNAVLSVNQVTGTILNDDSFSLYTGLARTQGAWSVSFQTISGQSYYVQRSRSLLPGSWETFAGPILGDGQRKAVEDGSNPADYIFYRVVPLN